MTAHHRADRISDRHERHAQMAAAGIRELSGHGVDRGEHPANAQARHDSPGRQIAEPADRRGHEHADGHDAQTAENGRAASDAIGDPAERDRANRHANQLHRQHDAEGGAVDAPLLGNARRREADRQHVEAVEGVQGHRDRHDEHLQTTHRRVGDHVSWICRHVRPSATAHVTGHAHSERSNGISFWKLNRIIVRIQKFAGVRPSMHSGWKY